MTEETKLTQKREELKRQLDAGEYKTLIDVMLDGTGRFIQKLTRSLALPPFWYSALVLALITLSISFLISILLGEFYPARREFILTEVLIAGILLPIWIGFKAYLDSFFTNVHDHLLDAIESGDDLVDFQRWLAAVGNQKRPLFLGLVFGILYGSYRSVFHSKELGSFIGYGPTIFLVIIFFASVGISFYYFFLFIALPGRLGRYRFELYAADPSSSEIIDHLSDMLSNFVYLWAVLTALAVLLSRLFRGQWDDIWLIELWIPLILLFAFNQYALRRIITRAKWETLNDIQAQVETLQAQEAILGKETLGHIDKLLDYHDRIKATRNSALDVRAGLNFLNSLLLPLLAFVLANSDRVVSLFAD